MTRTPAALRRRVLERIEPTPARTREAKALAAKLSMRIKRFALARGLRVEPKLVGSLAKDTHLADPLDVDLFLLFPTTTSRPDLEKHGVALGKKVLRKPVLKYAEHPYVHGRVGDLDVDVVPAYKLKDPTGKLSAVDRTPFHTEFVRRRATASQRTEIRLLKRFLRGTRCYGAETATGGFSGYLAELLVLRYGSFDRVLAAAAVWKPPVELSLDAAPTPMGGALVFIDPVDASRNAAAAVHTATLERLQRAAMAYRAKPRWEFFFPNEPQAAARSDLEKLLDQHATLGLEIPPPVGRPETVLPQAQRLGAKVRRQLETEGFEVVRSEAFPLGTKKVLLLFEHRPAELPATYEHRGPRVEDAENVARFGAKWKGRRDRVRGPFEAKGRWHVEARRTARTPRDVLRPRVKDILQGFDVPKTPLPTLVAGAALAATPARRLALTLFLERRDPWEH